MFLQQEDPEIEAEDVLAALANTHDRAILALAQDGPVTAQQILEAASIPKSTVYRRLNELEAQALLEVVDGGIDDGRRVDRYACPLAGVSLRIEDGEIDVDWTRREDR